MPTCISVNNLVCHYKPDNQDNYQLKKGDIIRVEMAAHLDNKVVTLGDTIILNEDINQKCDGLNALKSSLSVALKYINPYMETNKLNKVFQDIGDMYGLKLLKRPFVFHESDACLTYDWVRRDDNKFLEQSWVVKYDQELDLEDLSLVEDEKYDKDSKFHIGEVYFIEIAYVKSDKPAIVSDKKSNLFQKTYIRHGLKTKSGREICNQVNKKIGNYFFRPEDLDMPLGQAKIGLSEGKRHFVFRELGLIEHKETVYRLKCSFVINENNIYILTGKENIIAEDVDNKLNKEYSNILKRNPKFNKKNDSSLDI